MNQIKRVGDENLSTFSRVKDVPVQLPETAVARRFDFYFPADVSRLLPHLQEDLRHGWDGSFHPQFYPLHPRPRHL